MVKPIDRLRNQIAYSLIVDARRLSAQLTEFKLKAFSDIGTFVETSHEEYGVQVGGQKGNITLITFDGRYKVVRQIAEYIQFDERLQAAKSLVDECTWSGTPAAATKSRC